MTNPVWKRYILHSLPNWLDWFANNHTASHIQLFEKFILANPYYVADLKKLEDEQDEFMLSLIYNEAFINSLSEKGLTVWYYSDFKDFLQTLEPYTKANRDLRLIYNSFLKNLWWFSRVYSSIRNQLADRLEKQGKSFKQ